MEAPVTLDCEPMRKSAALVATVVAVCLLGASTASAAPATLSKAQWAAYLKAGTPRTSRADDEDGRRVPQICSSIDRLHELPEGVRSVPRHRSPRREDAATKTLSIDAARLPGEDLWGVCEVALALISQALYFLAVGGSSASSER